MDIVVVAQISIEIRHGLFRVILFRSFLGHLGHRMENEHLLPQGPPGFTVVTPLAARFPAEVNSEAM